MCCSRSRRCCRFGIRWGLWLELDDKRRMLGFLGVGGFLFPWYSFMSVLDDCASGCGRSALVYSLGDNQSYIYSSQRSRFH